ncbi:hypothetical protein ABI_47320 [Asticcacaulis biprosthecium C19]|uniref:Uncharacterized protein n=1 Tax=Asticcacaulis biprosthecium C19 TaxID=715226 RepID=F4QU84_9CAUL|nr:hypothetical protein ABI_47320 [Asticcacaulis biprosthecium C19]
MVWGWLRPRTENQTLRGQYELPQNFGEGTTCLIAAAKAGSATNPAFVSPASPFESRKNWSANFQG